MTKRIAGLLVIVLAVMLVPAALPQMEPTPTVYTFVSQFQVPRANWAGYSEDTEKTAVPVLEKLTADGTILSWSTFEYPSTVCTTCSKLCQLRMLPSADNCSMTATAAFSSFSACPALFSR